MNKLSIKLTSLFFATTLLISCGSDDDDNSQTNIPTDAVLYANFQNDGTNRILTIDENLTAGPIQIENKATVQNSGSSRFDFIFSGVTFSSQSKVYEIERIVTQTETDGTWSSDTENFLKESFAKSLDIVLVLDVSASLGDNIEAVKTSAVNMVKKILAEKPNSKVGVVKFSRGNVSSALTSNVNDLTAFISNKSSYTDNIMGGGTYDLEGKSETALYEAMLAGSLLLDTSNAKGKGLITFTDGKNNFQFNPINDNKTIVVNKLKNSNIKSYTIGFIGNDSEIVDTVLIELAINGAFSVARNLDEVQQVFTRFSNSVSSIYDLSYNTNNATFTGTRKLRFLFDLKLISQ